MWYIAAGMSELFFPSYLFCFLFPHLPALGRLYPVHSTWAHSAQGAGAMRGSSASSCYSRGTDTLLLLLLLFKGQHGLLSTTSTGKNRSLEASARNGYKHQLKSNFVNGRTTYACNLGTSSSVSCPKRRSVSLLKGEQQVYTALLLEDINPFQPCKWDFSLLVIGPDLAI